MWTSGVYVGNELCYRCSKKAQRYCEICRKKMCLDHSEILTDSGMKSSYKTVCKECKKLHKGGGYK